MLDVRADPLTRVAGAIPCSALGAETVERSESAWGWDRREGSGDSGARLAGRPGFGVIERKNGFKN